MEICLDCGSEFEPFAGPTHAYIGASASCWNTFSLFNIGQPPVAGATLAPLTVDAYAAQHPGDDSPQATQSVACHLVTLTAILDGDASLADAVALRKAAVAVGRKAGGFPKLAPPVGWPINLQTVIDAPDPVARGAVVDGWIRSVVTAWRIEHSATIDAWTADTLSR